MRAWSNFISVLHAVFIRMSRKSLRLRSHAAEKRAAHSDFIKVGRHVCCSVGHLIRLFTCLCFVLSFVHSLELLPCSGGLPTLLLCVRGQCSSVFVLVRSCVLFVCVYVGVCVLALVCSCSFLRVLSSPSLIVCIPLFTSVLFRSFPLRSCLLVSVVASAPVSPCSSASMLVRVRRECGGRLQPLFAARRYSSFLPATHHHLLAATKGIVVDLYVDATPCDVSSNVSTGH